MFVLTLFCPGCGGEIPVNITDESADALRQFVVLDKPYCSEECANTHALGEANVDPTIECPVCGQRQVEVGKSGKKRCINDHVWENRNGLPMYLRDLTDDEIARLREEGSHD